MLVSCVVFDAFAGQKAPRDSLVLPSGRHKSASSVPAYLLTRRVRHGRERLARALVGQAALGAEARRSSSITRASSNHRAMVTRPGSGPRA